MHLQCQVRASAQCSIFVDHIFAERLACSKDQDQGDACSQAACPVHPRPLGPPALLMSCPSTLQHHLLGPPALSNMTPLLISPPQVHRPCPVLLRKSCWMTTVPSPHLQQPQLIPQLGCLLLHPAAATTCCEQCACGMCSLHAQRENQWKGR